MASQEQQTTIAILGADALAEDILAQLLREEGYATRLYEALPTGLMDDLLADADLLLLTPSLHDGVSETVLGAMKNTPRAAATMPPVLSLSHTFKEALLDELAVSEPWRHQFKQLVRQIEAALRRRPAAGPAEPPDEAETG